MKEWRTENTDAERESGGMKVGQGGVKETGGEMEQKATQSGTRNPLARL